MEIKKPLAFRALRIAQGVGVLAAIACQVSGAPKSIEQVCWAVFAVAILVDLFLR
jgi:hypothetical protein